MENAVGVVGAGIMGRGIAELFLRLDYSVKLVDVSQKQLDQALSFIHQRFTQRLTDGKVTSDDVERWKDHLHGSTSLTDLTSVPLVIEAVPEVLTLKEEVWVAISTVVSSTAILATNTSSFSITRLSNKIAFPNRFMGMHFFFPAQANRLVEIIKGELTDDVYFKRGVELARSWGKVVLPVYKDTPAFVVSRLLMVFYREAIKLVEQGTASFQDIDMAVKAGLGHPLGPFELLDSTGLDVNLSVMEYLFDELGEPHYFPPQTLKRLVYAGKLGKKTSSGFYNYKNLQT